MEKLPVNPECELSGTKYCYLLNMGACQRCTVRESDRMEEIVQDLELYETLLPNGGVSQLFTDPKCVFCRQEPRGERSGFAILDMAHPEPKRVQRWLLGKKVSQIGTMIPVQMSICGKCRRTLLIMEYLPAITTIVIGLASLLLVGTGVVADALSSVFPVLPFVIWIALTGLAFFAGRLGAKAIGKRVNARMYADALEIPALAEMTAKGWKPVTGSKGIKVLFSKSRVSRGLGTAPDLPRPPEESAQTEEKG